MGKRGFVGDVAGVRVLSSEDKPQKVLSVSAPGKYSFVSPLYDSLVHPCTIPAAPTNATTVHSHPTAPTTHYTAQPIHNRTPDNAIAYLIGKGLCTVLYNILIKQ